VLERSDNPAIVRRKGQPLRVGLYIRSQTSHYQAIMAYFADLPEMLTFAYARARSALGLIIHLLNLYHND